MKRKEPEDVESRPVDVTKTQKTDETNGVSEMHEKPTNADEFELLRNWADIYVGGGQLSCMNMSVMIDTNTVFQYSTGKRDIKSNSPASLDTIFRLFSLTKCITSTAVMLLVERGKLSLEDPVAKYIPSFKDLKVYVSGDSLENMVTREPSKEMTIRDLLTHRAGFTYGVFGTHFVDKLYMMTFSKGNFAYSLQEVVDGIAKLPLMFDPGSHFTYSISSDILGFIIDKIYSSDAGDAAGERQVGSSFREFVKTEILEKLGMLETEFYVPEDKLHRLSTFYSTGETVGFGLTEIPIEAHPHGIKTLPPLISGGGGLFSTLGDYEKFLKMLLNYGQGANGVQLLKRETVLEMTTRNELGVDEEGAEKDVCNSHFDQEGLKDYAYYKGMGWNLMGWMMVNEERAFGSEHSALGEYGWSGYGGLWFGLSHLKVRKDGIESKIGVGIFFMSQVMPDKGLPTIPQFRWAGMKAAREHLKNNGYELV